MYLKSATVVLVLAAAALAAAKDCHTKKTSSKLFCYYGKAKDVGSCKCSHVILPASSDAKSIEGAREKLGGAKILLTVNEFNEGLVNTLKKTKLDGLEIDLKKLDSKNDISDFISTVRSRLGSDLYLALAVPSKAETLAKYYDFKALSKSADVFIVQTHFLGASKNVTFHPSRLSGLWDVQNTDSVVDLISGLGAPLSKLVISAPVQGFKFVLQNEKHTAPGSPAVELSTLTRDQLCEKMSSDKWMLERDEDQAGPYIFRDKEWVSFEDTTSMDIKAKYSRIRGLAGLALKDLSQDGGTKCGDTLLEAAFAGLSRQARAPRGAVLHSLEREILQAPARVLDNVQVSPYRISRVIDVEGKVHVIRQDTRTEFECSRQGYFVHPRSCGRFYRCVKFDQLSDEFSVFEFDCPAGLAFDSRVEVCVWPGSLPHASACSGSSEIAPVPKDRFICPGEPGYYADPANCRWFFACLDHGKSPLSAYEFRCPYGLVFDQERLLCEWSWLVPKCGSGSAGYLHGEEYYFGHGAHSGGYALDQYNGLGVLSGVKLGGLHGPLVQPVQKTYSSFSHANDNLADVFGLQKSTSAIGDGNLHFNKLGGGGASSGGRGSGRYNSGAGSYSSGQESYAAGEDGSYSGETGSASAGAGSYNTGEGSYNRGSGRYNAGGLSLSSGGGSYNAGEGSSNSGSGSLGAGAGSYNAGQGSFTSGGSSYNAGEGSSNTGSGSFSAGAGSYNGGQGSSSSGGGSYNAGEGSSNTGSGSFSAGSGSYNAGQGSFNSGAGHYNEGSYTGGSGDYSAGAESYNAGQSTGSYNIGAGSRNSASAGFNAGAESYNAGQASGSYNAEAGSHNSGSGSFGTGYSATEGSLISGASGYSAGERRYNGGSYKAGAGGLNSGVASYSKGSYSAGEGGLILGAGEGRYSAGGGSHSSGAGSYIAGQISNGAESSYTIGEGSVKTGSTHGTAGSYSAGQGSYNTGHGGYNAAGESHSVGGENFGVGGSSFIVGKETHSVGHLGTSNAGDGSYTIELQSGSAGIGSSGASSGSYSSGISHSSAGASKGTGSYSYGSGGASSSGSYSRGSSHGEGNSGIFQENSAIHVAKGTGDGVSHSYSHIEHGAAGLSQSGASGIHLGGHSSEGSQFNAGIGGILSTGESYHNSGGSSFESQKIAGSQLGANHRYSDGTVRSSFSYGSGGSSNLHGQEISGGSHSDHSHSFVHNAGAQSGGFIQSLEHGQVYAGEYSSGLHSSGEGNTYSFSNVHTDHLNHATQVHSAGKVHHTLGHVNIIAGGSSGVAKEGIELIQHGVNLGSIEHVTPISVVSSPIPSVTSVPIPTGHVSELEFFNGGVVANLPDLQYKLEHPTTINAHLSGYNSYNNIKAKELGYTNYTQFVSSTQAPLIGLYDVKSTSGPVKTITNYHITGGSGGYVYNKPTIQFEEKPKAYLPPATATYLPPASSTYLPPVVSTYLPPAPTTYLPPAPSTYLPPAPSPVVYLPPAPKPTPTVYLPPAPKVTPAIYAPSTKTKSTSSVSFTQHIPQRSYVQPLQPAGGYKFGVVESHGFHKASGGYHYSKPTVAFEQKVLKVQPTVSYQEIKHQHQGYHYDKPTVAFEEKPQILHQAVVEQKIEHVPAVAYQEIKHNIQPVLVHQEVKPAVTYHEVKQEGYHYEKPAIAFEENVQPAVTYQEIKHDIQPAVSFHHDVKVQKEEGYHYEKPVIAFEEKVQPAVTYQEIKHDIQPVVSYHHDVKVHKDEGYHYEKPAIAFEEHAVQNIHVQPAVTYQDIKHHIQPAWEVKVEKHEGYHYEKPTIAFEEKHNIQPVVVHQHVKPAVTYHEVKQEGYHYEKPTIAFEEKVQPAVTYQEIKHDIQPTLAVNIEKHEGYHYEKPSVVFEEKKVQPAVTYQEIKFENKGYRYEKPSIAFEEKPLVHVQQPTVHLQQPIVHVQQPTVHVQQPVVHVQQPVVHVQQQVYHKPAVIEHKVQPVTYQEVKVEQPAVAYQEVKHEGYHYEKPAVTFKEAPVVQTHTYQKPAVLQTHSYEKAAVVHHSTAFQEVKNEGYHYENDAIKFEHKPIVHVQQPIQEVVHVQQPIVEHKYVHHNVKPTVAYEERPVVHVQHRPIVQHKYVKPAVAYQEINVHKEEGYHYEKPAVQFEEKSLVHTVQHQPVTYQEIKIENQHGYHYEKPSVAFEAKRVQPVATYQEIQPIILEQKPTYQDVLTHTSKPAIISSFSIQQPRQKIVHEYYENKVPQAPTKTYLPAPKPTLTYLPAPEPTLTYLPAPTREYLPAPKPTIAYLPVEKPTQTYIPVKRPVKTYIPVEQKKTVVEEYYPVKHQQTVSVDYSSQEEIVEEPIVAKKIPLSYHTGYEYPQPAVRFEEAPILSTPRPTFASVVEPVTKYKFTSYDTRVDQSYKTGDDAKFVVSSTPAYLEYEEHSVVAPVKQSRPIVRYEFSSLDDKYNQNYQHDVVVSSTFAPLPDREYLPVKEVVTTYLPVTTRRPTTRRPVVTTPKRVYLPVTTPKRVYIPVRTTTEKYVEVTSPSREYLPVRTTTEKYVEVTSPSREYLPVTQEIYKIKAPKRVYLPVTTTEKYVEVTSPSREYLPVTQEIYKIKAPKRVYLPVTTTERYVEVTKPSRDYLPVTQEVFKVKSRKRIYATTQKPSREYLPVVPEEPSLEYLPVVSDKPNLEYLPVRGSAQVENYQIKAGYVPTRRSKIVKVVKAKSKPIIKVNDFHPILSAKLGAQCTCVSNTLTLRKKPKALAVDEVREDLPYVIDDYSDDGGVVVEDFKYDPQKVEDYEYQEVDVSTRKPEVSEAVEVFVKKSRRPVTVIRKKVVNEPSKEEIAAAVDTGLKLVKSAVKEGVKEGVKEALEGKEFDRYGPGGVRGRGETLQGTVDCQRAGLFRHPKHCNKFYACRWDCDKKRFTLHVFNCPVHLTFDGNLGACNWPSQGPACVDDTLLPSA